MSTPIAHTIALTAAALFLSACTDAAKTPSTTKAADPAAKNTDTKAATTATAPDTKRDDGVKIACFGANACSGQSQCNVADGRYAPGSKGSACVGQNECKGKGWLLLSTTDCDAKNGEPL